MKREKFFLIFLKIFAFSFWGKSFLHLFGESEEQVQGTLMEKKKKEKNKKFKQKKIISLFFQFQIFENYLKSPHANIRYFFELKFFEDTFWIQRNTFPGTPKIIFRKISGTEMHNVCKNINNVNT